MKVIKFRKGHSLGTKKTPNFPAVQFSMTLDLFCLALDHTLPTRMPQQRSILCQCFLVCTKFSERICKFCKQDIEDEIHFVCCLS